MQKPNEISARSANCPTCGRHRWDREGGAYRGKTCTRCPREGRRAHKAALGYPASAPLARSAGISSGAAPRHLLPEVILPSAEEAHAHLEAVERRGRDARVLVVEGNEKRELTGLSAIAGFFHRKRGAK